MQVFGVSEFAPEMERWNIGYQIIQKNKLFHMATNGDEHVGPETVMGGGGSRPAAFWLLNVLLNEFLHTPRQPPPHHYR
jgi:hypothetical protein